MCYQKLILSLSITKGRFFTSVNTVPTYSPVIPIKINCIAEKKNIREIFKLQKNVFINCINPNNIPKIKGKIISGKGLRYAKLESKTKIEFVIQ